MCSARMALIVGFIRGVEKWNKNSFFHLFSSSVIASALWWIQHWSDVIIELVSFQLGKRRWSVPCPVSFFFISYNLLSWHYSITQKNYVLRFQKKIRKKLKFLRRRHATAKHHQARLRSAQRHSEQALFFQALRANIKE